MSSDDVVRELCARVVEAEGDDFQTAMNDLQAAMSTHIESLRTMAVTALLSPSMRPPNLPEA